MLTRHFYNTDEVVASLQLAILNGRVKDCAFWLQELIDSGEEDLAFKTMLETWLFYIRYPLWLEKARIATKSDYHELAMNLALCKDRDTSLISILALQGQSVDRIIRGKSLQYIPSLISYFQTAIRQGRSRSAWWAAQMLGIDTAWDCIGDRFTWIRRICNSCPIWLCACILYRESDEERSWMPLPTDHIRMIDRWIERTGRRDRRVFTIPCSQLCGIGQRWKLLKTDSNLKCLYEIEKTIISDRSGFWWKVICNAGFSADSGTWSDDDALEKFYTVYFPDDIPDEWSLEDQKRSHGSGMLRSDSDIVTIARWARSWLSPSWLARGCWGSDGQVQTILADAALCDSSPLISISNIHKNWICPSVDEYIRPVLRQYVFNE